MKKALVSVILLIIGFGLSGCSPKTKTADQIGAENGRAETVNDSRPGFDDLGRRMPDFGQPQEEADIRGLVTAIIGNEVTILKVDRPGRNVDAASSTSERVSGEAEDSARALGSVGGSMPTGMRGSGMGMRGAPGENSGGTQADIIARLKEMSSGEEKIIIPVGIKMLKLDTDTTEKEEPKMLEATLSDVKSNSMITVWLDDSVTDKKVASFVMIAR
jgi:hypothetical protein